MKIDGQKRGYDGEAKARHGDRILG